LEQLILGTVIIVLIAYQLLQQKFIAIQNAYAKKPVACLQPHYAIIIEHINRIESMTDLERIEFLIKNSFSNSDKELLNNDFAYLILIIDHLKLKFYQISDDVFIITNIIQRIYEHIIYEKSKFH